MRREVGAPPIDCKRLSQACRARRYSARALLEQIMGGLTMLAKTVFFISLILFLIEPGAIRF